MTRLSHALRLALCIVMFALSSVPRLDAAEAKPIIIAFDLDETIFTHITPGARIPRGGKVIDIMNGKFPERYLLREGALEALESFSRIPGARICLFSYQMPTRNVAAAHAMKLSDGRSVFELTEGRIFSLNHMVPYELKKNLKAIDPNIDLTRAFLIDDDLRYVAEDQIKNVIWVRDKVSPKTSRKPAERRRFFATRNKLAWARGLFDIAQENAARTGRPLVEEVFAIQHSPSMNQKLDIYVRGIRHFKRVNPSFRHTTLIPDRCTARVMDELLDVVFRTPKATPGQ